MMQTLVIIYTIVLMFLWLTDAWFYAFESTDYFAKYKIFWFL